MKLVHLLLLTSNIYPVGSKTQVTLNKDDILVDHRIRDLEIAPATAGWLVAQGRALVTEQSDEWQLGDPLGLDDKTEEVDTSIRQSEPLTDVPPADDTPPQVNTENDPNQIQIQDAASLLTQLVGGNVTTEALSTPAPAAGELQLTETPQPEALGDQTAPAPATVTQDPAPEVVLREEAPATVTSEPLVTETPATDKPAGAEVRRELPTKPAPRGQRQATPVPKVPLAKPTSEADLAAAAAVVEGANGPAVETPPADSTPVDLTNLTLAEATATAGVVDPDAPAPVEPAATDVVEKQEGSDQTDAAKSE